MANNYLLVTTFNKNGYDVYGRKMLESFLKHWPKDQSMLVYTEDASIDDSIKSDPRVMIKNLNDVVDLVSFKTRHKNNPAANGHHPNNPSAKDFKFDAVRFSHKVFALYDAICNYPSRDVIWMDADTLTHADVPNDFLESNFPAKDNGIAYLGRTKQYSECGFVVYHMQHPMMRAFWETFANHYRRDTIFNLEEWHDSFVFDVVRREYEAKGMRNHNITPEFVAGHPFINCVLGEYMDHMKGPRKTVGRSRKNERNINPGKKIAYWQE